MRPGGCGGERTTGDDGGECECGGYFFLHVVSFGSYIRDAPTTCAPSTLRKFPMNNLFIKHSSAG
jgi:hypothetical protein